MRILIIDDDDDIREIVALILGAEGHEVVQAKEGQGALEALYAGSPPSVILLDLMMPGLDGAAFMEILRNDRGCAIPDHSASTAVICA